MFCNNCGANLNPGEVFCPNCGARNDMPEQQVNPFENQNNVGNEQTFVAPEKSAKKFMPVIIAAVAVVAALILVIALISGSGSKAKYADENAFADAMKQVDKDSEQRQVLDVMAAAMNLVFNSESFEYEVKYDSESVGGKVIFGKDITSSKLLLNSDDFETYGIYENGMFSAVAWGDEGVEMNVAKILEGSQEFENEFLDMLDEEIEDIEDYGTDEQYELVSGFVAKLKENMPAIDKAAKKVIADNHINYDAFVEIYDNAAVPYFKTSMEAYDIVDAEVPSLDTMFDLAADFIATGLDANDIDATSTVTGKGKSKATEYSIEVNLIDLLDSLVKYASSNEQLKNLFDEDAWDYYAEEIDYMKDYKDWYDLKINATVQGGYITKLKVKVDDESFTLNFANVNDAKITDEEIAEVKNYIEDADDIYEIADVYDIIDEMF